VATYICAPGYIATDPAVTASDLDKLGGTCASWEGAVDLATTQYVQNVVSSTITVNVTAHITCVNGRTFGLPGPNAPIKQAAAQGSVTFSPGK